MTLPNIHGEFRVGTDPELRFTPTGKAVCKVRVVASKRTKNEHTNEWEDGATCWLYATGFGITAENMAECLKSGQLVSISGQLEVQEWTDKENNKRTTPNLLISSIGPSLSRDYANVVKRESQSGGQASQNQGSAPSQGGGGTQGQPQSGRPAEDEPPF